MIKGRKKYKSPSVPKVDGDFNLQACDFSLHCSGLAILHYDSATRSVSVVSKTTIPIPKNTVLGRALSIFYDTLSNMIAPLDVTHFVRERPITFHYMDSDRLMRIAGAADIALWKTKEKCFYDISPSTAKKIIAGTGHAHKETVAAALPRYIGDQVYVTFDESDAIAVGIAYLIKGGYIDAIKDPVSK